MTRRIGRTLLTLAVGALPLAAGVPGRAEESVPASRPLDLSIRARALGLVPEPRAATNLGLDPVRATTGAGVSRMPKAATGNEGGLYIGVVVCDPDGFERVYRVRVDDPGTLPEGQLRGMSAPPRLVLPGRPLP